MNNIFIHVFDKNFSRNVVKVCLIIFFLNEIKLKMIVGSYG